jgi:uncharacterized protein
VAFDLPPEVRPGRRAPYPAGRAVAVVLLGLFLAALLDADSLVAAVSSERYGTARTVELALVRPFRAVSDALRLNLPHHWLAEIGGTNQSNPAPPPSTDEQESTAIRALLGAPSAPPHAERRAQPRTLRVPTAASPVRVWLAGDSLMGDISDAFVNDVTGDPLIQASVDVQIGTGLARPDVFDWPGVIGAEVQQHQPDVVVLTFGANDNQPMVANGQALSLLSPAWDAEYARRVSEVMSEVTSAGGMLVWILVPPIQRAGLWHVDQVINGIVRQQAALHPGVQVVDPGPVVAPGGRYTEFLGGHSGIQVRDTDGVHLTEAGANLVVPLVLAAIRTGWALP